MVLAPVPAQLLCDFLFAFVAPRIPQVGQHTHVPLACHNRILAERLAAKVTA